MPASRRRGPAWYSNWLHTGLARRAAAGRRRPARVGEATSPPRIPSIKGEKGIAAQRRAGDPPGRRPIPADPGRSGSTITVSLAASGKQSVECGNNQNPSLNGRVISPSTNGAFASGSPSKATRGSTWDSVLNIHHTLTFSGAGGLNVAGPQT